VLTPQEWGALGGRTRAAKLSPEQRKAIASLGGKARHRPRVAWQRLIRDRAALQDPRPVLASLRGCRVEPVTRAEARPIILRYEWLGTMGTCCAWYGLRSPEGDLLGVVGFSRSNPARDLSRLGSAVCLQRGACVHWAPKNAGSFLIRHAVRLAHREHGWRIFYGYADPEAGEVGTIYQALGWTYTGRGAGRTRGRARDQFIRPDGRRVDERLLRRHGLKLGDVLGWKRVRVAPKHRYIWVEGGTSHLPNLPYPKRSNGPSRRDGQSTGKV